MSNDSWDKIMKADSKWTKFCDFKFEPPFKLRAYKLNSNKVTPLPSPLYVVIDGEKIKVN